jgi:hypothetical protein
MLPTTLPGSDNRAIVRPGNVSVKGEPTEAPLLYIEWIFCAGCTEAVVRSLPCDPILRPPTNTESEMASLNSRLNTFDSSLLVLSLYVMIFVALGLSVWG